MINKKIIISSVSCLMFFLIAVSGCEKQDDVTPEPVVVKSFKIEKSVTASNEDTQKNDESKIALSDVRGEPPETAPSENVPVQPVANVKDKKEVNVNEELQKQTSALDTKAAESFSSKDDVAVPALPLDVEDKSDMELAYNPAGRIDPFEPLFQAKQEKEPSKTGKTQTIRDSRRGKLTPLEKLDISQLKLTAIILGQQRHMAMVQESTGKGHVIKKGTYIGINSGRVVEITKNIVIIEEEVEDLLGKVIVRKREMKLQKPLGEM